MGNALLTKLASLTDARRLRKKANAPVFRKFFQPWNCEDFFTALHRYENEFHPNKPRQLSFEQAKKVFCLPTEQLSFFWDVFAPFNEGSHALIDTKELFTSMALYCGGKTTEKIRFLLATIDNSGKGVVSVSELTECVATVFYVLSVRRR